MAAHRRIDDQSGIRIDEITAVRIDTDPDANDLITSAQATLGTITRANTTVTSVTTTRTFSNNITA